MPKNLQLKFLPFDRRLELAEVKRDESARTDGQSEADLSVAIVQVGKDHGLRAQHAVYHIDIGVGSCE